MYLLHYCYQSSFLNLIKRVWTFNWEKIKVLQSVSFKLIWIIFKLIFNNANSYRLIFPRIFFDMKKCFNDVTSCKKKVKQYLFYPSTLIFKIFITLIDSCILFKLQIKKSVLVFYSLTAFLFSLWNSLSKFFST